MTSPHPAPEDIQDPPPEDIRATLYAERAHHDTCRAALAAMVEGAAEQVVIGEDVSASGADAEVLGYHLRSQAKALRELPEGPMFFGRLDFAADDPEHGGQSYHVGRLRITEDPVAPPLVVDWRAPVSRAFYQASAREPQGVEVRRRFGWAAGNRGDSADLTGFEDEHLGRVDSSTGPGKSPTGPGKDAAAPGKAVSGPGKEASGSGKAVAGPGKPSAGSSAPRVSGIVAREIERPRVGPMRDIAATIQPEQDDLVRAGLTASVCVQGGPGTGKTAVGLHRAAYLLYSHPKRVQRSGLLILGPNRTFLSYIAEVLPALGETGVRQATLLDEIGRHPVTGTDTPRAAAVKHDVRMAEVLRRALYARVRAEGVTDLAVRDGSCWLRVTAGQLAGIVAEVRAEEPPYATGRERVRARVVRRLQEQVERRSGPPPNAWLRRVERMRPLTARLDEMWPRVRPEEVLAGLLTGGEVLARAAEGLLDAGEQDALRWPRPPRSYKSARWSAADLVLLDELSGLMEHPEGYGHIVVDEAQDLSPMECRAIARRAPFGSLTVLGDLAQGTTPWAARAWDAQLRHLGKPEAAVVPLTTGFRVPSAVAELANRLLGRLDVAVPAVRSLRTDGAMVLRPTDDVPGTTVAAVREALAHEGSVGVVVADADAAAVASALTAAGLDPAEPQDLGARVTVVPASVVKGLEYDHVVAVEPAAVLEAEERGAHRLYVVLTRAVSRLDVVHSRPLPF